MSILLKNVRIIDSATDRITNMVIQENSFSELKEITSHDQFTDIINGENLALMPSFIDLHCHLRDPGYTYKEDLESGQQAALAGGFTAICCMANTMPVCDNRDTIQYIKDKARTLNMCKVIPVSAVTRGLKGGQMVSFREMIPYTRLFSNDGEPIIDEQIMIKALRSSSQYQFTLLTHCEPETEMIDRDLRLLKRYGGNLHICHISQKASVDLIRKAKAKGLQLTCEVTPHHLYSYGLDYAVHPPFGKKCDRESLLEGLLDRTIDTIATDHAPHSREDKSQGARGLIGFEQAFSLVNSVCRERNIDIRLLSRWMSEVPAKILHIPVADFRLKTSADFVLVDIDRQYKIKERELYSKSQNTPFLNKTVYGRVVMTFKDGKIRYNRHKKIPFS